MTVKQVGDGQYRFGDDQKLCMVRKSDDGQFMVRVGGGWLQLQQFLLKVLPPTGRCFTRHFTPRGPKFCHK